MTEMDLTHVTWLAREAQVMIQQNSYGKFASIGIPDMAKYSDELTIGIRIKNVSGTDVTYGWYNFNVRKYTALLSSSEITENISSKKTLTAGSLAAAINVWINSVAFQINESKVGKSAKKTKGRLFISPNDLTTGKTVKERKSGTPKAKVQEKKNTVTENPPKSMPSSKSSRSGKELIKSIDPNPEVGAALKKVPLLSHLTELERAKLGGALKEREFSSGTIVLKEGDIADVFYIIQQGKASVLKTDAETKSDIFLRELSEGDHFGESAILSESETLSASVRADTYLVLWSLNKILFRTLFTKDRIDLTFATRDALTGEGRGAVNAGMIEEKVESPIPRVEMLKAEKNSIISILRKNPISRSQLFQQFNAKNLDIVVQTMELRVLAAGETIIEQGEEGDTFYVIQEGEVDVFQRDEEAGDEKKVDHHSAGSSFGELALMHNEVRNATVKAATDVKLRELRRLWVTRVATEIVLSKEANYREWLNNVVLLSPLTHADRARISEALEIVVISEPGVIFKQGDEGDGLYIIAEGVISFSAVDTESGKPVQMKTPKLREGQYFGERALVSNKPRAATAYCDRPCKLLKLDREAFVRLLGPLEEILKKSADNYEAPIEVKKWKPSGIPFHELSILGVLGRGSYGYVQLVKDKHDNTYALKAISKQRIVDTHQKEHIFNEKRLMQELDHPFLIKLYETYKDRDRIYFLLEPSLGGELFPILRKMKIMTPRQAKFYSAQVVLAFRYLHSKNLIYRDLKPENLLLDETGYIKITDFGFLKRVRHKTYTMCGTPEYMAPEVISHTGHGQGVDWWTLGIFIFEMLASYTPFYRSGSDNMKMYERITCGHFNFPSHVGKGARPLISGLLEIKPHRRYGCLKGGVNQIINNSWFSGFDWQGLQWRTLDPPMKVRVRNDFDVSNFKQSIKEKVVKPYIGDGTNWDDEF